MTSRIRKHLFRATSLIALLAVLAMGTAPVQAQVEPGAAGTKTALVVSISGYNELISDIGFLGDLIEKPGMSQMVEGGLAAFTGGRGLAGIDKTKPWGVAVQANGPEFKPLIFLPVESLDQVLTTLAPLAGGKPEKGDDGVYVIAAGPQTVYLKEANGWAFLAQMPDGLENLPADPVKLLGGLETQYDIAIQASIQNIDKSYRDLAVNQIRMGVESGLEQLPDEDDEQYQMRRQMTLNSIQQVETFFNESDQITIGWKIDAEKKATHLDVMVTAVDGTSLARQAAQIKDTKSNFAGFLLEDSAAKLNFSGKAGSPEDIARSVAMLDTLRKRALSSIDEDSDLPDDESRDKVKSALNGLFDVLVATIQGGQLDFGATVKLAPEALTFVAGGLVASGPDVEAAFKELASAAKKDANFPGVNWDADKHGDIRMHTMSVSIPDEDARQLFGDKLDVVLGVGEKSFYLSLGRDAVATLKEVIDKSKAAANEEVPPMQLAISLGRILKFAAEKDEDPRLAMIAEALAQAGDKDHINVRMTGIERGVRYRLEVEDGVLKAFGKAIGAQTAEAGF